LIFPTRRLAVAATSANGIVEALEMAVDDGRFVSCVQWHPDGVLGIDLHGDAHVD
jgi:gamma-glutamyl-gamma-aminobutyrate hydrolase PuuD